MVTPHKSKEEIIFSYPGLFVIYVYRLAHVLYKEEISHLSRDVMLHGRTGIDINPGANLPESIFYRSWYRVVVGETTEIGNNVKLYQGVTLGALSTRKRTAAAIRRFLRDNVTT